VIEFRLAVTRDEELGARYRTLRARSLELKSEVAEQMVANGAIVGSHDFRTMATAAFIFESGLALEDLAADEPHRRRTDLTADDDQDRPCHRDRQCALRDGAPLDLQTIPADLPFDEVILRLEAQRPVAIAAYASMLVRLAEAKSAGLLSIDPFVLSATSEPLDLDMIDAIEQAFEVRPTETFGSSEGVVGPTSLRMGV
jgi:hypothetical protein